MSDDLVVYDSEQPDSKRRALASARFIPQEHLDRQGYHRGDFWLGRTLRGKPFGWNEDMNLLTCAGPGAGKGVSTVVPNLLEFPGSAVVVDPKGELATMTAAYRRDILGHKVIVLDPARTANISDDLRGTYNPFDALDPADPYITTVAQVIASGIVVPNPKSQDPFWDNAALDFIQSCILYMVRHYPPALRTLMKLRETVSLGDKALFEAYVKERQEKHPKYKPAPGDDFEFFLQAMYDTADFGGVVSETAAKIMRMGDNTRGSVLSTASTHLDFVKSPELWDVLASNPDPSRTFRLRELRRQDRPLTVYLCLPVDMMPRQGRWFRMIVSQMTQFLERTGGNFDKRRDHPILMMIDEFYQLGHLPSIANTLTYARSSGLRMWLIVQDLNQVKANYPDTWETIIGACGIKQFFGVNDSFTAEYVSKLIGDQEIDVPSITVTETSSETESRNNSETEGVGTTETTGRNWSRSSGRSGSHTDTHGTNSSTSSTLGTSQNHTASQGDSYGGGISYGHNAATLGKGLNTRETHGGSTNLNFSKNTGSSNSLGSSFSSSKSLGQSHSSSDTQGWNESSSEGGSESTSQNRNTSKTLGWGSSLSKGKNYGLTFSKQARRLLRPEDVMLSFTKDNLVQLTHIRDHGGMLLFRTPFYADPAFQQLLTQGANDDD